MRKKHGGNYVGAAEIAQMFSMSKGSVYKLAAAGKIPSYGVGPKQGGVRFDREEVRRSLRRRPAATEAAYSVSAS